MIRRRDKRRTRISSYSSERLESRRVLSGYFNDVDQALTQGPGAALNQISTALHTLGPISNRLPLLNKPVRDVTQITDSLVGLTNELHKVLPGLDPGSTATLVRTQIYNQLSSLAIVGDRNGNGVSDVDDIAVTIDTNGVDLAMNLTKSVTFNSAFGIGLDSVPFRASGNVAASMTVTLSYDNFAFGFRNGSFYFDSSYQNELRFQIDGKLSSGQIPSSFTAGLGFLNVSAQDATLDNRDLAVQLTVDVAGTAGGLTLQNPRLSGNLDLQLNLKAEITTAGFPRLRTTMVVGWQFNNIDLNTGYGSFGAPTLKLNSIGMNISSLTSGIIQTMAQKVQYVLEPFQPILDTVLDPIPGISDFSRDIGGPDISLPSLASAMSQLPNPPEAFLNFVHAAEKLKAFSNQVDALANDGGDAWIEIGSFDISGAGNSSLLTAASALSNLGLSDWSSLIPVSGSGIDYNALRQQIAAQLPGGIGDQINGLFDQLTASVQENGLYYDFPIVKNPTSVALGFLLGRDADLVTLSGRYHLVLDHEINVSPVDGIVIIIHPAMDFDAFAKVGFDTRGLRDAMAPLYSGGNFNSSALLNGLYIDKSTHLNVTGSVDLRVGPGIPQANLTVGGGMSAGITMTMDNSRNLQEPAKLRPFAGELGDCFFLVGGSMKARASVGISVGGEVGGKFVGIKKEWTFAEATIFEFQTDCIPNPQELSPSPVVPVVLATLAGDTLTLAMGSQSALRGPLAAATRENFTVRRFFYDRPGGLPGIRVSVSAFGVTQNFSGFSVHRIVADGGTDDDEIHVYGNFDEVRLNGGSGNDILEFRGIGSVVLNGDDGADTLRAENGVQNLLSMNGGTGYDKIYIGAGRLDGIQTSLITGVINAGPDGGSLYFDNSEETEDTTYEFIRPAVGDIESAIPGWRLIVSRGGQNPYSSTFRFYPGFEVLQLISGSGNDQFLGYAPLYSQIEGRAGDDVCRVYDPLNTTSLPVFGDNYRYVFDGGAGNDSLPLINTGASNSLVVTLETNGEGRNSAGWGLTTSTFTGSLYLPNVENVSVVQNSFSHTNVKSWTGSSLKISGGLSAYVETSNYWSTLTNVDVTNVPLIAVSDRDWAGFATLGMTTRYVYKDLYNARGVHVNFDDTARSFIIDGSSRYYGFAILDLALADRPGLTQVVVSGNKTYSTQLSIEPADYNYDSINHDWLFEDDMISGGNLRVQTIDIQALSLNIGNTPGRIEIQPVAGSIQSITASGSPGDDQFIVGSVTSPFSTTIHANLLLDGRGEGDDTVVIHDESLVERQNYELLYGYLRNTRSQYSVGTKSAQTTLFSSATYDTHFDIGGWTAADWDLVCGTGNDSFSISDFDGQRGRLTLQGGSGINSLALDNSVWPSTRTAYIYSDHIRFAGHDLQDESDHYGSAPPSPDAGSPWNGRAFYDGVQSIQYTGTINQLGDSGRGINRVSVVSTIPEVSVDVRGNAGSDEFVSLGTEDGLLGMLDAILGSVTVSGGFDPNLQLDHILVFDTLSQDGCSFEIAPNTVKRGGANIMTITGLFEQKVFTGSGADDILISSSDVTVLAGPGADHVTISGGRNLIVHGEQGDDVVVVQTLNPSNGSVNTQLFGDEGRDEFRFQGSGLVFNPSPALLVQGGTEIDSVIWDDTGAPGSQAWTFNTTGFGRTAGPIVETSTTELIQVTATDGPDQFVILGTEAALEVRSKAGTDSFFIGGLPGSAGSTRSIQASVFLESSASEPDEILVNDRADTVGRRVHSSPGRIGAAIGDDLFGPGGSLRWKGQNQVRLNLSDSGSDTVIIRPDTIVPLAVFAGGPTAARGDALTFDVTGLASYQFMPGLPGAGILTGSFGTVSTADFESGPEFVSVNTPVITGPTATTAEQQPKIQWQSVADAISFDIWFADLNVSPAGVTRDTVTLSEWVPPRALAIGQYRVWVRARTADNQLTPWSLPLTFRVNTPVTMVPLEYRQNTLRPAIRWEVLPGAVRYEIQVDDTTRGIQKFVSLSNLATNQFVPDVDWPLGNYKIWVRGIDRNNRAARWATAITLSVSAAPVALTPVLSTFENVPEFTWTTLPGAVSYDLQLRNRTTGMIFDYPDLRLSRWTPDSPFSDGNWSWYIRGQSEFGARTFWSSRADFYVGGRPTLLSPLGTVNGPPLIQWTPVTGALRYELTVNRTDVPSRVIQETTLTQAQFAPARPLASGTYRAWVRAVSVSGQMSPWSTVLEFQIAQQVSDHTEKPDVGPWNSEVVLTEFISIWQIRTPEIPDVAFVTRGVPMKTQRSETTLERTLANPGMLNTEDLHPTPRSEDCLSEWLESLMERDLQFVFDEVLVAI